MASDRTRTILYHVVGPVHPRNLQLIATEMPQWHFRMVYEPELWWMDETRLASIPFDKLPLTGGEVPDNLSADEIAAVVFSTVQPRSAPLNLLAWALEQGIPTIAIEESNQMALDDGSICNYLLPVDHICVASPFEEDALVGLGIPSHRVSVTGWPFFYGSEQVDAERRLNLRQELGLDPDRPVAGLSLTAFNDAGETENVRRKQLILAAEGLPDDYQLAVKPHPIEKMSVMRPFLSEHAPNAVAVDGERPISDFLDAVDVLLNRGVSQVAIEALTRSIPVIVLAVGDRTPFHDVTPEVIVERPSDLAIILSRLETSGADLYDGFRSRHMPFSPPEARKGVSDLIARVAAEENRGPEPDRQRFELALYMAWKGSRAAACDLILPEKLPSLQTETDALRRLVEMTADLNDLETLRSSFGDEFGQHILSCLWIDMIRDKGRPLVSEDIQYLRGFPPRLNVHLFFDHCRSWLDLLSGSGFEEAGHELSSRLLNSYAGTPAVAAMVEDFRLRTGNTFMQGRYRFRRLAGALRDSIGSLRTRLRR